MLFETRLRLPRTNLNFDYDLVLLVVISHSSKKQFVKKKKLNFSQLLILCDYQLACKQLGLGLKKRI